MKEEISQYRKNPQNLTEKKKKISRKSYQKLLSLQPETEIQATMTTELHIKLTWIVE